MISNPKTLLELWNLKTANLLLNPIDAREALPRKVYVPTFKLNRGVVTPHEEGEQNTGNCSSPRSLCWIVPSKIVQRLLGVSSLHIFTIKKVVQGHGLGNHGYSPRAGMPYDLVQPF